MKQSLEANKEIENLNLSVSLSSDGDAEAQDQDGSKPYKLIQIEECKIELAN